MSKILFSILVICLNGCGALVPVTNLSKTSPEKMEASYKVKVFTLDNSANRPEITQHIGNISSYSCKQLVWDPPASKGNALDQLRLKAMEMGADGIIDVVFDSKGTDTWGTNCWETVQASGVAVKFKTTNSKD